MNEKLALVIVDVQMALCHGPHQTDNAQTVIAMINRLITKARAAESPIIFIQHQASEGAFVAESAGWQLEPTLLREDSDIVVRKSRSDAFLGTDLSNHLESLGANHLVICGMQSEFCVDSTVRCALAKGFNVTVSGDAHTTSNNGVMDGVTIARHHNVTWENITSYDGKATVILTDDIVFS